MEGAYGMLPHEVARDKRVSPELLILIGFRLTFADQQTGYGLGDHICNRRDGHGKPILSQGLSRDVFRRGLTLGDKLGLIKRWQPAGKAGLFSFAQDQLDLPRSGASGFAGRRVYREWFDASLALKEMAALLFLRAGTGKGPGTYCRELMERFDWSKPTALKVIMALNGRGLIEARRTRDQRGCFRSTSYVEGLPPNAATVKNTGDGFYRLREKPPTHAEETPLPVSPPSFTSFTAGESPRRTERSYVSAASPAEAAPLSNGLAEVGLKTASENPRLLGWVGTEDGGPPAAADLLDVIDPMEVMDITGAVSDAGLAEATQEVTGGRVHAEIVAPAGLHAIRVLAAYVLQQDRDLSPGQALGQVLRVIREQIGDKGRWLNSLSVIGLRIAGEAYKGRSLAAEHLEELRRADGAKVLASRLFGAGKGTLTALINEFGTDATISAIKAVLRRAMIDGMAPCSVTTWSYFKAAIAEQVALEQITAAGLRPGDCFGMHRAYQH
ncbi:MAG: hypothetical protein WAO08_30815 [Hyphomicrobiaceae bacterium]